MINTGLVFCADTPATSTAPGAITLLDKSRYGNNGTMSNVTWARLPSGLWVMLFNGTNAHVVVGICPPAAFNSPFSYSFWFNPTTAIPQTFMLSRGAWETDGWQTFIINNCCQAYVYQSAVNKMAWTGNASIYPGLWYHLVYTLDTVPIARIYCNNTLSGSFSAVFPTSNPARTLYIGSQANCFFPGYISHVKIYNYTLSPAQVWQIYQNERWWFNV